MVFWLAAGAKKHRAQGNRSGTASQMLFGPAGGSHNYLVGLIDFGSSKGIRRGGRLHQACARTRPPFWYPELRAAHRVGAPIRRRGRSHASSPYDAAHT
jgi:hypothetical protein